MLDGKASGVYSKSKKKQKDYVQLTRLLELNWHGPMRTRIRRLVDKKDRCRALSGQAASKATHRDHHKQESAYARRMESYQDSATEIEERLSRYAVHPPCGLTWNVCWS
jgi:predicted nucleotidyltransferase